MNADAQHELAAIEPRLPVDGFKHCQSKVPDCRFAVDQ
jgi:hypothetical protein